MKWGWLVDNLGLKLFALLLAVLLYLHVLTDRTVEETVEFPLVVSALPESLALASSPPATVAARLRGTGKQILRLRYLKPPLEVSLAGVTPGTFQRTFGPADVPLAGATGVTVLEIVEPARMSLEIDPRGQRFVPVRARLVGSPARGFLVAGAPRIRPARVRVTGPATWLAAQESLATEPIVITGRKEALEVTQALVAPPPFAHAAPGSVLVAVTIEAEEVVSVRVPIEVRGIRSELRAEPQPGTVVVTWRGPRSLAGKVEGGTYRARVDAGRRGRGEWLLPVEVTGPGLSGEATPGRTVASARPESTRVVLH
jgi:YbbR domain-containing protein